MKKFKKMSAFMLAVVMALAMSITAFAQTAALNPADKDNATITINNAAKGETYYIYKLFDATVGEDGQIAYQCPDAIPEGLTSFFTKDAKNNVIPNDSILVKDADGKVTGTNMTEELKTALEAWAKSATVINSAVSDGSALEFTGLPYGYYVMTTTHKSDADENGEVKSAITVTSTQPKAEIFDKNTNKPGAVKETENGSYSIGDTVKYTATFDTTNYIGEGKDAKQIVEYVISDTLPEFLSNPNVTKISIGKGENKVEYTVDGETPQFDAEKKITIPWAEKDAEGKYTNTSLYAQGDQIVVEYEAVLTSTTNIGAANKNTIKIEAIDKDGNQPWSEEWEDSAEITTYAAAIKKVDDAGNALAGAVFTIAGLTVEAVEGEPGVYRVVSYDPDSTTPSAEMTTDENGKLYIIGLAEDVSLIVTEVKAPDGYNKLTETKTLSSQVLSKEIYETSGERHYDEDGNLVSETSTSVSSKEVEKNLSDLDEGALEIVNNQGTLLPSTGGIGTTIFYIIGGILVIGAGIILVVKKRASNE